MLTSPSCRLHMDWTYSSTYDTGNDVIRSNQNGPAREERGKEGGRGGSMRGCQGGQEAAGVTCEECRSGEAEEQTLQVQKRGPV